MKSLIANYERHLREEVGAAAPGQRSRVVLAVSLPWIVAAVVAALSVELLDLPRTVGVWIIGSVACIAVAGVLHAGWRVAMYCWQFDRTPASAPWTQTQGGEALIQALRRVTLNGLSGLTASSRLRADLKLTAGEVSALLGILTEERWLDARRIEGMKPGDLTVEALLGLMSPTPTP